MEEFLNGNPPEYDDKVENELKKIKLSLEHGLDFSQSSASPDLPPEIERQFLDYMQEWENQYTQRKLTTVREIAGCPVFKPINELAPESISSVLDDMMALLNRRGIRVETLCDVDDNELYRFVMDELLDLEINDISIEGMMHCFTYEEFHPNHPHDIKNRCTEIIIHIADGGRDESVIPWGLANNVICGGQEYTKEEFNASVNRFRELFNQLEINDYKYTSVAVNDVATEASAIAVVKYSGTTHDGQTVELKGEFIFRLKCEYEWWMICQMETPWKITA